jgi:glycosyltransferase involved in cell wall biosynthesis
MREEARPAFLRTVQPGPDLAVLVLTRNEAVNIEELLRRRAGGLGGAVVEGLGAVSAPWACVLGADLQHPPEVIPRLLDAARRDRADIAVASRYCGTGAADGLGPVRA